MYDFIYLFFMAVLGLHRCVRSSSVVISRGSSRIVARGRLIATASLIVEHRTLGRGGLQHFPLAGLVAPWPEGSSQTRDQASVLRIARWALNQWTTKEAQVTCFLIPVYLV